MSLPATIEGEQLVRAMADMPAHEYLLRRGRRHRLRRAVGASTSSGPSARRTAAETRAGDGTAEAPYRSLSSGLCPIPPRSRLASSPTSRRRLGGSAPRPTAGGRVGPAGRRQGPSPQLLPRAGQAVLLQPRPPRARRADRPRGGLHRSPRPAAASTWCSGRCCRTSCCRCRAARRSSTPRTPARSSRMADIFPGARVVEAGVGSGALTCSLLRAVGPDGRVHVVRAARGLRRGRPAQRHAVLRAGPHPAWRLRSATWPRTCRTGSVDRVVLDMLAPWECLDAVADALVPGRRSCAYVATDDPAVPHRRERCASTAASPSRRPGSRWCAAGTSRGSPSGPTTDDRAHRLPGHRAPDGARRAPAAQAPRPAPGAYGPDYAGPATDPAYPSKRAGRVALRGTAGGACERGRAAGGHRCIES